MKSVSTLILSFIFLSLSSFGSFANVSDNYCINVTAYKRSIFTLTDGSSWTSPNSEYSTAEYCYFATTFAQAAIYYEQDLESANGFRWVFTYPKRLSDSFGASTDNWTSQYTEAVFSYSDSRVVPTLPTNPPHFTFTTSPSFFPPSDSQPEPEPDPEPEPYPEPSPTNTEKWCHMRSDDGSIISCTSVSYNPVTDELAARAALACSGYNSSLTSFYGIDAGGTSYYYASCASGISLYLLGDEDGNDDHASPGETPPLPEISPDPSSPDNIAGGYQIENMSDGNLKTLAAWTRYLSEIQNATNERLDLANELQLRSNDIIGQQLQVLRNHSSSINNVANSIQDLNSNLAQSNSYVVAAIERLPGQMVLALEHAGGGTIGNPGGGTDAIEQILTDTSEDMSNPFVQSDIENTVRSIINNNTTTVEADPLEYIDHYESFYTGARTCPAPIVLDFSSGPIEMPLDMLCTFAEMLSSLVLLFASLYSVRIILGGA